MVRFIEFHSAEKKNKSFLINVEDISIMIIESNENYSVVEIKMRDGSLYRVAETKEQIAHILNHIR